MLVANGQVLRIELEDDTINMVSQSGSYHHEIKVATVIDVGWKEPGLLAPGFVHFAQPGGRAANKDPYTTWEKATADGYVWFGRKSISEFRAFRDAIITLIDDGRRFGAYFNTVLRSGFTVPPTTPETPGVEVRRNYRIGEIRREFDSQTAGAIQGAMHHELGIHGSFTSGRLGRLGIGLGQMGLSGMSSVDLKTNATTRSDFLNDGFVAIFDEPTQTGVPETLRVIVPSEEACRERIADYMNSMYVQMGLSRFGHSHDQLITAAAKLVTSDISYVSDRLSAVLRTNADKTSVFNVVGITCGQHMMLGGAIQMQGDDRWLQLFPVGLLRILSMPLVNDGTPEPPALP